MTSLTSRLLGLAVAAICVSVAVPAFAQSNQLSHKGFQPVVGMARGKGPEAAPPSGLPGAAPNQNVAPATRAPTDMQPTDALFDAINRGDITVARDAINRGADMSGHNLLGMTPLELSVDLGRNDITFLLLSLRGSDDGDGAPPANSPAAPLHKAPPSKLTPVADRPATQRAPRPATLAEANTPAAGGGTPDPRAGFLGFGTH